ncbi:hypothetical protein GGF31_006882 [Allomyces arbusculus]|nr:hypothetical protein GGF31_006882 [Allomyces arbusculus]
MPRSADDFLARMLVGEVPRPPTERELAALGAALDTIVAPVPDAHDVPEPLRSLRGTDVVRPDEALEMLRQRTGPGAFRKFMMLLSLLAKPNGTWLLSGGKFNKAFPDMSLEERVQMMLNCQQSTKLQDRTMFVLFKGIADFLVYSNPTGRMPAQLYDVLGYPGPDPDRPKLLPSNVVPQFRFIDISAAEANRATPLTMKFDAVIVGSGAGGGVTAATLARAGLRVVVIEKGQWYKPEDLPLKEFDTFAAMYDRGGMTSSEDASISLLAGNTVGGGTTINWAASLRPQVYLRDEWSKKHGLSWFGSEGFQQAIDAVCDRLGVGSAAIKQNRTNSIIFEGCKKLGMHVAEIPQNTRNQPHECGYCGMGCSRAVKQSSALTWLVDATKDGAQIIQSCHVEKILMSDDKKTARGVQAVVGPNKIPIIIEAPTVVVSGGSIHTPALLLRSGLKNPNIGRHLGLHPVCVVLGYYHESTKPYSGSMMTAISNAVENRDGKHYGAKIEATTLHPVVHAAQSAWASPADNKRQLAQLDHGACMVVLTRDRDRNARIILDDDGSPVVQFAISEFDGASAAEGMARAAQILITTGAHTVVTGQRNVPAFKPPSTDIGDPKAVAFIDEIRAKGVHTLQTALFSAHQMGTARMATTPARGVTNPRGQVWGTQGLYVSDASLFPTSSGVNPMITVYSVAYSIAHWIVEDVKGKKESGASL